MHLFTIIHFLGLWSLSVLDKIELQTIFSMVKVISKNKDKLIVVCSSILNLNINTRMQEEYESITFSCRSRILSRQDNGKQYIARGGFHGFR
jgi:hypothetical protein